VALGGEDSARTRIAVLDLKAERGLDEGLVKLLNELLLTEFERTGEYEVIGGSDLQSMLALEQQKRMLECEDIRCLSELGGALGVDKLAFANIGKIGAYYLVNVKIIDVRESKVVSRISHEVKGIEDQLLNAVRTSVRQLLRKGKIGSVIAPTGEGAKPPTVKESRWPAPIGALPITLWAIGGAGIVTGTVFGFMMKEHEDNANNPNFVGAHLEIEKAESDALVANIAFGVGAAGILAGLLIWLLSEEEVSERPAIIPIVTREGAGIGIVLEY
jgi:hypothetical protein